MYFLITCRAEFSWFYIVEFFQNSLRKKKNIFISKITKDTEGCLYFYSQIEHEFHNYTIFLGRVSSEDQKKKKEILECIAKTTKDTEK